MKYKIKVEKLSEKTEDRYPSYTTIYEQYIDDIDLQNVIAVVNKLENPG